MRQGRRVLAMTLALVVVAAVLGALWANNCRRTAKDSEVLNGLAVLKEHDISVFACYRGLYELDCCSGEWGLVCAEANGQTYQEVAIDGGRVYFCDHDADYNRYIYGCELSSAERKVLTKVSGSFRCMAISHCGKRLAYASNEGDNAKETSVNIVDVESHEAEQIWLYEGQAYSIAWSADTAYLFLETDKGIVRFSLADRTHQLVGKGEWVNGLKNESIVYVDWREGHSRCFKKHLPSGSETNLFGFDRTPYSIASDATGRFMVGVTLVSRGLFRHGILLTLHDTATEKSYRLPIFKYVTHCIFLQVNSKGPGLPRTSKSSAK